MTTTSAFAAARHRYASSSVTTASPARLLVMLYERLVRDLASAETAVLACDLAKANAELQHAQQIVLELRTSLDTTAWSGAAALADLYTFLYEELVRANLEKDVQRVRDCQEIVGPLCDAWRQAAQAAAGISA